jgi:Xaa-Pro aminopeptidase
MKSDLDRLMAEAGLDALWVRGSALHNPAMAYFTGQVHVSGGDLFRKRGEEPILVCDAMEREEAAHTGLQTRIGTDFGWHELLQEAGGDVLEARTQWYGRMLREFDIHGRVAIYGQVEAGPLYATLRRLEQQIPGVTFVGELEFASVVTLARMTKDETEVERIRAIGRTTVAVIGEVASFLTSHQVRDGMLVNRSGEPLTVGEVKRRINLWLAMREAENPEGTIFSVGRDAGVPHSTGAAADVIRLGTPIIFDIYPCEAGGGYFYDITRTWCVGHAPDEVLQVYEDVLETYQAVSAAMALNTPCRQYQRMTCELFEAKGHPTIMGDSTTQQGYVHSLGHGVGLAVHEGPSFRDYDGNDDLLQAGSVITIEPGLYYPERGLGVRLEDTIWVRPDGGLEILADFPKDLVLKVPGG